LNDLKKSASLRGKDLLLPVKQDAIVASSEARHTPAVKFRKADNKKFIKYYTVKKGDTLRSVARRFSVSEKIIAAWNNLKGKWPQSRKRIIVAKFVEKNVPWFPGDENG
jgi:membrane-bound lytic murein transglycosylase D